jgi:uncharacterized membrane protein
MASVWSGGLRSRAIAAGCVAFGVVLAMLLPRDWSLVMRGLIGWDVAVAIYLIIMIALMSRAGLEEIQRHAGEYDEGRILMLAITLTAAAASVVAIVLALGGARSEGLGAAVVALVALTIAASWTLVHLAFALHYAHEYYTDDEDGAARGLNFPGHGQPLYGDFAHFAFVIGCAGQTADIEIASPALRRVVTAHCIAAFVFNTAIIALTINVAAGLAAGK